MKVFCLFLLTVGLVCSGFAAYAQGAEASRKAASPPAFDYSALEQVALKKQDIALQGTKSGERNAADHAFTGETDPVVLRGLMEDRQSQQVQGMTGEARKRLSEVSRHADVRQKAIRDSLWKKANYPVKGSFLEKTGVPVN